MDETEARRAELYRAYDEAALQILMDRYGEDEGEKLLEALEDVSPEEASHFPGADLAVARTLESCARKERQARQRRAALRALSKAAVVLLALGALVSYTLFSVSAHEARTKNPPAPDSRAAEGEVRDALPGEENREEWTDEEKTAH